MLSSMRHELILEKLSRNKSVEIPDLVKELDASESTIRRDIAELHARGLLKKVHGGAVSSGNSSFDFDHNVELRENMHPDEKERIALYAAGLVKDNDVIYIDSGTTTFRMIKHIDAKGVVAVTNSIRNAIELCAKGIRTIILGGEIKQVTEAVVGHRAVEWLKEYNFQKAFLGTNGVDINKGCTTPDPNEASIKEVVIKKSQDTFILADSSKINKVSMVTFCNLDMVTIITGNMDGNEFETDVIEVEND